MSVLSRIRALRSKWERAVLLCHEGEFLKASIGAEVYELASDAEAAWEVLVQPAPHGLGLHANTARGVRDMGQALAVVADPAVWRAAGWRGVKELLPLSKAKRSSAIKELLETSQGKRAKADTVRVIVSRHGGKPAPRPAARPAARAAATPAPPAEGAAGSRAAVLEDALREALRLVPLLRERLDPRAVALVDRRKARGV